MKENGEDSNIKIITIGMLFVVLQSDRVSITTEMTLRIIRYYTYAAEEINAMKKYEKKN